MNKLNLFTSACLFGICNHVFANNSEDMKQKIQLKANEAKHSMKAGANIVKAGVEYLKVKFYEGEEKLIDAIHSLRDKLHYMQDHLPTATEIKANLDLKYQEVKEALAKVKNNIHDKAQDTSEYIQDKGHNATEYFHEKTAATADYLNQFNNAVSAQFDIRRREFEEAYASKKAGFAEIAHQYRVYLNSLWDELEHRHEKFYQGEHNLVENIESIRATTYKRNENSVTFNQVKESLDKKYKEIKALIKEKLASLRQQKYQAQLEFERQEKEFLRQEKELLNELDKNKNSFENAYSYSAKNTNFADEARSYRAYLNQLWEDIKHKFIA